MIDVKDPTCMLHMLQAQIVILFHLYDEHFLSNRPILRNMSQILVSTLIALWFLGNRHFDTHWVIVKVCVSVYLYMKMKNKLTGK